MSLFFSLGVILGALLVSSLGGWGAVVLIPGPAFRLRPRIAPPLRTVVPLRS